MKLPIFILTALLPFANQYGNGQMAKPVVTPVTSPREVSPPRPSQEGLKTAPSYVIGADDVLQVNVWKELTLSGSIPVRPDGMISMALIGDLPAAGKTPMQLATDIEEHLKKYIQDPNVTVVVSAVNSHRIFAIGEVQHVGPIPLSAGMTALQAISAAGGLTPYADKKHIYILRNAEGKEQKIPFDYKAALKGTQQGVSLQTGDTIVVP